MKRDLRNDEARYNNWLNEVKKIGISDLTQKNSDLIIQHIEDMEAGRNVNRKSKAGRRGYNTLNTRKSWRITIFKNLEKRGIKDVAKITEKQIHGFFDDVKAPTDRDLELLAEMPDETARLKKMYGLNGFLKGMTGLELKQASIFEPTCTICGLDSGYHGPGSKTVLPAEARAKVDFRLVPDQDPADILRKLRHHLDQEGFGDIQINHQGSTKPARTDPDDPFVLLANQTAETVYGQWPSIQPMSGGSGPNHVFINALNLPVISSGVGYPGAAIHAPNEHIRIEDFRQGIRHIAYLIEAMGRS